eukprot:jgi/Hompol1/2823/HPOL_005648-RA
MSTIVRELWGRFPSFLKLKNKTLLDLVGDLPNSGKGLRVIPTVWHQIGRENSWFEIDRVELEERTGKSTIYGTKVENGQRQEKIAPIHGSYTRNWRFYEDPAAIRALERKLHIKSPESSS